MKTISAFLGFVFAFICLAGSDTVPRDDSSVHHFADLAWFFDKALPDVLLVLEGLPHPRWEPGVRAFQIETKSTIKLGREVYYERPSNVSETDKAALFLAAHGPDYFYASSGPKLCGGFHGDYCVIWKFEDSIVAQMHICFGCNQALFCRGEERLVADLSKDARKIFMNILVKYRDQRPKYEEPKSFDELFPKKIKPSVPPKIKIELGG